MALQGYLSPNPEPNSLYSMSQNMNYKLANGMSLTANEKFVANEMLGAMHDLGKNLSLTRYDHETFIDGLLSSAGIKSGSKGLTDAQMKSALVGTSFQSKQFLSTSYNNFKNAGNNVFDSRAVKINYKAKSSAKGLMPGRGAGGDFGEMILAPSVGNTNKYTILDVKTTNKSARSKGTQNYNRKQIEITIGVE